MHNPALVHWLHRITVPSLVLWGDRDGIVAPSYGEKLAAALGARPVLRVWEADNAFQLEVGDSTASSDLAESDLTELRDRVEALGGRLTIAPDPEGGTRLSATVPFGS